MHDVLKKLFDKVIFYEADCIKVGRKLIYLISNVWSKRIVNIEV